MPHGNVRYADRSRSRLAKKTETKPDVKPKETSVSAPEKSTNVEPKSTPKPEVKKEEVDDLGKVNT